MDIVEGLTEEEEFWAQGNHLADQWALKAEKLHPSDDAAWKQANDAVAEAQQIVETIGEVMSLWPFAARKAKRVKSTTTKLRAPRVAGQLRHKWVLGTSRWQCVKCRASTRTACMPAHRRKQRCTGALDRLVRDHEQGLNHCIVEFTALDGDFSICRRCGAWGMKRAIKLAETCECKPNTRRTIQAWDRTFRLGHHPNTGRPFRRAADGGCGVHTSIGVDGTRSNAAKKLKRHRLLSKTKRWAAALNGISAPPGGDSGDGIPDHPDDECASVELEQPWDWMDEADAPTPPPAIPVVTPAIREAIEVKRAEAMRRKQAREELAASNRLKAAATKRRRMELQEQKNQREFMEYRKLNDPFYTDSEDEEGGVAEPMTVDDCGPDCDAEQCDVELPATDQQGQLVLIQQEQRPEDVPGWLESALEEVMEQSALEQARHAPASDLFGAACQRRLESTLAASADDADELFGDFPDVQVPTVPIAVHVDEWELDGVDPAYLAKESERIDKEDVPATVSHVSWCTMQGCSGNCCISAASASRAGERQRQEHNRAVAAAGTKRRTIVEETAGIELTPAQAKLARMLAKVRRTDQQ